MISFSISFDILLVIQNYQLEVLFIAKANLLHCCLKSEFCHLHSFRANSNFFVNYLWIATHYATIKIQEKCSATLIQNPTIQNHSRIPAHSIAAMMRLFDCMTSSVCYLAVTTKQRYNRYGYSASVK